MKRTLLSVLSLIVCAALAAGYVLFQKLSFQSYGGAASFCAHAALLPAAFVLFLPDRISLRRKAGKKPMRWQNIAALGIVVALYLLLPYLPPYWALCEAAGDGTLITCVLAFLCGRIAAVLALPV